eukprot:7949581-Karenia_brevis.AAC.1
MEEEISKMKQDSAGPASKNETSLYHRQRCVIGGLQDFSNRFDAEDWIRDQFSKLHVASSFSIETRDDMVGMLFCKFLDEDDRDDAVAKIQEAELRYGGERIWCRASQPAHIRIPQAFLF